MAQKQSNGTTTTASTHILNNLGYDPTNNDLEDNNDNNNNGTINETSISNNNYFDITNEDSPLNMSTLNNILPNMSITSRQILLTGLGIAPNRGNSTAIQDIERKRTPTQNNSKINNSHNRIETESSKIQPPPTHTLQEVSMGEQEKAASNQDSNPKAHYAEALKKTSNRVENSDTNRKKYTKTPQVPLPAQKSKINNQNRGDEEGNKEKYGYRIVLAEAAAPTYKQDKYHLAYELERGFKTGCNPYKAYIKDNIIHYMCFDKKQHEQLPTVLGTCKAFNESIEDIIEEKFEKEKEKMSSDTIVYATITSHSKVIFEC